MKSYEIKEYKYSLNYNEELLAELYDTEENYDDDVKFIQGLIGNSTSKKILECFSGTGRILLPLLLGGHQVTGIELAESMSNLASEKIGKLPLEVQSRAKLKVADVLECEWGEKYDTVVIGCNALYELPDSDLQRMVVQKAHKALRAGGNLYIDNNDYKGNWGQVEVGKKRVVFEGTGKRGDYGKYIMDSVAFDEDMAILHMKRTWVYKDTNGNETIKEYMGKKHPVKGAEVEQWLLDAGFRIIKKYGDVLGNIYEADSPRAIFWVEK